MYGSSMKLHVSDPQMLLTLCSKLYDRNGVEIQRKINEYLQEQTGASIVFLVLLLPEREEGVIQVVGNQQLEHEMRFPVTDHTLNEPIKQRSAIACALCELDEDLKKILCSRVHPAPQSFFSVPVPHPQHEIITLLACFVDYQDNANVETMFSQVVLECFRFCLGTVLNTFAYEEEVRLKKQCQSLLCVARNLFSHLGNMSDLLREIMAEARKLTNAERCSLFLLDNDHNSLVAKVFDGELASNPVKEIRISKTQGIAGHVACTGELLNIRNAYEHPLFYRGIDEATGFKTRNLLCFPICKDDAVIGVAELCNKIGGYHFDVLDEEVAMAFSIYCGISIMHSRVYKKIQDAQARSKLSNELMMYHMKVSTEDVKHVMNCQADHSTVNLSDFAFSSRYVPLVDTPCLMLRMFEELGFVQHYHMKCETLVRFILFVKKGYRDTPYHNWMHAFSVTHFAYQLITNLLLIESGYITILEGLALLISCCCHDLDHRGTTNSFQMMSGNVLARLYSSEGSVMERHHLSQALCILNTEDCNILECLSQEEYTKCLDLIRDMILATDMAHHYQVFPEQQAMAKDGYEKSNPRHRNLLLCLLMTCCDLSDQTKSWKVSKKIAELLYEEFFKQGDLEKSMGSQPIEMMDRERAKIPDLQVQFLNAIVIPLFQTVAQLFPSASSLLEACKRNRNCWEEATDVFADWGPRGVSSMDILNDPNFETRVLSGVSLH